MGNIERTGKRDLIYSNFLRKNGIACSDLDFAIYDEFNDIVIAIIEAKQGFNNYPSKYQHRFYLNVARSTHALYYIIQYELDELDREKIIGFKFTEGESLIVEGRSGFVNVKDTGKWTLQRPDEHAKWLKRLVGMNKIVKL